jgi:hypothetical protein
VTWPAGKLEIYIQPHPLNRRMSFHDWEVVAQISETEALEGLGRCAADFRIVYETLKL